MGKNISKSKDNDLESHEGRQPLNRMDSQNYPCKFSWQQHNVDSSNLPTFIKITRAKEDAIFGSKQQNINRRYDRTLSQKLKYSSVGEESRKSSEDSTISSPSISKKRELKLHPSSIFSLASL